MKRRLPAACALALAACATAPTGAPAPEPPRVGGIALGHDTLDDVALRLGAANRIRRGNTDDVATEICYRVRDATNHELELRFAADERSGDVVTQSRVMPARPALAAGCTPVAPEVLTLGELPHGLSLGQTPDEVAQALSAFTRQATAEGEVFVRTADCRGTQVADSVAVIQDGGVAAGYVIGRTPGC
ncbi:hypothetical protein [Coralloluteibacterium thermophilus]|uniref:Lipoprotein n=1 Tax=Coralloluteibacterium thermophilum TaxID=2707049 RepID=A0ABV9NM51_9GAMM